MSGFLRMKDGWLCVEYVSTFSDEPVEQTLYWAVAQGSERDFEHLIGKWARELNSLPGGYEVDLGYRKLTIVLIDGGRTKAIACERRDLRRPKGKQVRWRYGKWEKYLKTKGWVAA